MAVFTSNTGKHKPMMRKFMFFKVTKKSMVVSEKINFRESVGKLYNGESENRHE